MSISLVNLISVFIREKQIITERESFEITVLVDLRYLVAAKDTFESNPL